MRCRFEPFGGILASEDPPFLAFVDRDYLRKIGLRSELWQGPEEEPDLLSAPTEVHLATTHRCSQGCSHCYVEAGPRPARPELDRSGLERAFAALAELGVFHVALGGGEALERSDLLELARAARREGLVPNLTISGRGMDEAMAERFRVFGQVNVSIDGLGPRFRSAGRGGRFEDADRALGLLVAAGVPAGINCVLSRRGFPGLAELFSYAAQRGANEIELLRYKPVGRARSGYDAVRCTDEQHRALVPRVSELSRTVGLLAKIDCSFVPMLCCGDPPPRLGALRAQGTYGCEAGNVLLGVDPSGRVAGCSFLPPGATSVFELPQRFASDPELDALRRWHLRSPPEPCASCPYLTLCKGGCRAVSAHLVGDPGAPDPECPRVLAYQASGRGA